MNFNLILCVYCVSLNCIVTTSVILYSTSQNLMIQDLCNLAMIYNATFPVAMVVVITLIKSIKQNFKAKLKKTIVYEV
jgi:hypothetical protein